ncbi:MAG: methyltransferase domain-containing protein [Myxococcales bacterium]|nr:methyltransferase domain-containing protein [Myxococcales bacterium]
MASDDGQLSPVCAYIAERTGTSLSSQQAARLKAVLDSRLSGRKEEEYLAHLSSVGGAAELAELISAIVVHKTDLFRDEVQLGAFRQHLLRPLCRTGRPLRLWSAGCATGEEVATLLVLLEEEGAHPSSTVLGTDLSAAVLERARRLSFPAEAVRRVPPSLKSRYFREREGQLELLPALRARACFCCHNLMDMPYPFPQGASAFDVIFCRNVLIYFTEPAFDQVVAALAGRLVKGGTLVLSAAEPILRPQALLDTVRHGEAFFYCRRAEPRRKVTGEFPAVPVRRVTGEIPVQPVRRVTGEMPALCAEPPPAPVVPEEDPREEAVQLFHLVLEWAAAGESDEETEKGLRRCLYLDPHFAQARYLLGMLLEQRGALADAAAEYRRALSALCEGRSQAPPFFLNNERLKVACELAVRRVGFR